MHTNIEIMRPTRIYIITPEHVHLGIEELIVSEEKNFGKIERMREIISSFEFIVVFVRHLQMCF